MVQYGCKFTIIKLNVTLRNYWKKTLTSSPPTRSTCEPQKILFTSLLNHHLLNVSINLALIGTCSTKHALNILFYHS